MKRVFITGASSGIGLETALLFKKEGWEVIGTSRSEKHIDGIRMIKLDICSASSIEAAFTEAFSSGRIDLVVQCAGSGRAGALEDFSDEQIEDEINILLTGASRVIRTAIGAMRRQGGGRIIVVGSVASVIPLPYQNLYSACKAALLSLVSAVRLETEQFGIDMCLVAPGDTKTGFTSARRFTAASTYGKACEKALAKFAHDEENGLPPVTAAKEIFKAANRRKLRLRYSVCAQYKLLSFIYLLSPQFIRDSVIKLMYLK